VAVNHGAQRTVRTAARQPYPRDWGHHAVYGMQEGREDAAAVLGPGYVAGSRVVYRQLANGCVTTDRFSAPSGRSWYLYALRSVLNGSAGCMEIR
jgi:hypothetical protein